MPEPTQSTRQSVAINNTVKLTAALQQRVLKAMAAEGFTVWSEFCRVALTEKCAVIEDRQRVRESGEARRPTNGEGNGRPKNHHAR